MLMRVNPRPGAKSCLKIWLTVLFVLSYGLVILFMLYNQKRKALGETLERVTLPSKLNDFPRLQPQVDLQSDGSDVTLVRDDSVPKNPRSENDSRSAVHWKRVQSTHASVNETELRIISYPNETHFHFATFGLTTPKTDDFFYAFCAPLAVRAWKRIGYDSIVFIVGDIHNWLTRDTLKHIYNELVSLHPVIVFLKPKPENEILISQAARLFASNYFSWKNPQKTFIVTSDVDLWPLNAATFDVPTGKSIVSLNSECCGSFDHGSHTYKLIPLGNVVASVTTWKEMINVHGFFPRSAPEIIDYFFRDFGPLALERTRKDEYVGWYMDQRIISMRLDSWMTQHGGSNVEFVARDVGRDRIDSNYWMPFSLFGKNDIHALSGAHKPGTWEKIRPLIKLMFSKEEEYKIVEYRELFMRYYMNTRKYTR